MCYITGLGSELFASELQYVLQNYFTCSEACLKEDGSHFQQFCEVWQVCVAFLQ
jgi:hypothetical protein